ncbi:MAG: sigma-70 family RNA polymerase sigma factor [Verrucomicrobiae bacterium]|nr:sigma-70 family RNA polymerase sigma factor [Verrucomicrobiae bacterium]MCP5542170.1 sigma-70 family RNA polymerase sigma factor [Akkermansiaceae bacterium]
MDPNVAPSAVPPAAPEDYAELMAAHQGRLESFIRSLTGDRDASKDVLQETNLVLLRKAREFRPGTNFAAWAFRVARFEVMTWRRRRGRNRLAFDDELVAQLADTATGEDGAYDVRIDALRDCLAKLPERQRVVIEKRYLEGCTVAELAETGPENANAISQLLFRARQNLLKCVSRQSSGEV